MLPLARRLAAPAGSSSPCATTLHRLLLWDSLAADPSSQPAGDFSGKIGPAPSPVPRVGSAPDTTLLLPGGVPRSASPGPAVGGSGVPGEPEDPSKYAFYNIKRYRTYFNVDTTVRLAEGAVGCV